MPHCLLSQDEDAEESRSANMLERFLQNYQRETGSHGDEMKGLQAEFCGWEKHTKGNLPLHSLQM